MSEGRARQFCSGAGTVIYTSDFASLLATIDTLRDQLRYVEETIAPELVFYSPCKCDIASGDTPCAHCAAVHFHNWYQINILPINDHPNHQTTDTP